MTKSGFIGLRVDLLRKRELVEFAKRKGITLSDYVSVLIELGLERAEELRWVEEFKREKMLNRYEKC
jgi:post-segregation antitoxin (ccd killing protein)